MATVRQGQLIREDFYLMNLCNYHLSRFVIKNSLKKRDTWIATYGQRRTLSQEKDEDDTSRMISCPRKSQKLYTKLKK